MFDDYLRCRDVIELQWLPLPGARLTLPGALRARVCSFTPADVGKRCVVQPIRASENHAPDRPFQYLVLDVAPPLENWSVRGTASVRECSFDRFKGWNQVLETGPFIGSVTFEKAPFDPEEVLQEALTARGSRMLDAAELKVLLQHAVSRCVVLQCSETWELTDGSAYIRTDLNAYVDDESAAPIDRRLSKASAEFERLLEAASGEPCRLGHQVWATDEP